jgi:Ni/Co efflux regulator RcnB
MKATKHTLAAALVLALLATLADQALAAPDGTQRQHTSERTTERNSERASQRQSKRTKPAQEEPQPCPRRFRKRQDNWMSRTGQWLRERFKGDDAPPQQHQGKGEQVARRER